MALLTKAHPLLVTTGENQTGPDITWVTLTYPATMAAETTGTGTTTAGLAAVQRVMGSDCTIVAVGPLFTTGTQQTFALEGCQGTAAWDTVKTAEIVALAANFGTQTLVGTTLAIVELRVAA